MISIYKTKYEVIPEKEIINQMLFDLPETLHQRAKRYIFDIDAYNFVLGRLLLKEGLEKLGLAEHFNRIEYQKNGKPFLKNVFFNISHTDNLVVCALSTEGEIGIDVEKRKTVEVSDFKPSFSIAEWTEINNSESPLEPFYWYWVRKESIIKAIGEDLSYLHQIEIDPSKNHFLAKGKKWHLEDLDFGAGYKGAICSEYPIKDLRIF